MKFKNKSRHVFASPDISRGEAISSHQGDCFVALTSSVLLATTMVVFFLFLPQAFADAVYLASGEMHKGVVVEEYHDRIVLSTYKGEIEILKDSIDEIFFDNEEQNYAYLADKAFWEGDFNMASGLYQKARQINPDFLKIEDALSRLDDAIYRENLNIKPEDSLNKLKEQLGIEVERRNDNIGIKNFLKGAKISTGDIITVVWDVSVKYMDAKTAACIMIGEPGTLVKIAIEKNIYLQPKQPSWFKKLFSFLFFDDFGFKLALRTSGLFVSHIKQDGAAEKSGLQAMDEVTHINGESVRYMPLSMARKKIFHSNHKEVILTIKRSLMVKRK